MTAMILLTFLLIFLAGAAKAVADAEDNHYRDTWPAQWAEQEGAWGRFWQTWSGPDSWWNKYRWSRKLVILEWLLQGPLVFVTDLWHFANMVKLTAFQSAVALWLPQPLGPWWSYVLWVALMKLVMGSAFELVYAGWRGDLHRIVHERKQRFADLPPARGGTRLSDWILIHSTTASLVPLILGFFLSAAVFWTLQGDPEGALGWRGLVAIGIAGAGLAGSWLVGWWARRRVRRIR